jgi:uncharacterized protein
MAQLRFETLTFREKKGKNNHALQVTLLSLFSTEIPVSELNTIGPYKLVDTHTIEFSGTYDHKAQLKFSGLLHKYFAHLTNKLTGNPVTYIHKNSGIPLIGNVAFGIMYRNSSIIEIKPVTSCNLDCIYCSISEGLSSKKRDFVIEKDFLLEELEKVLKFAAEPVEIHIGVQGEPFLYDDMILLIEDLQKMTQVNTISIDTNGTLLTTQKIDRLSTCDKLQINFSLDSMDETVAKKIAGIGNYNLPHVTKMISYATQKEIKVIIAPVCMQGYNENEMEKIVRWIKSLPVQPILGIQNFLAYKTGRNPTDAMEWKKFYSLLETLEKKYDITLKLKKEDFNIHPIKEMPKPFIEGDEITLMLKCSGRFENSSIGVYKNRTISVPNCTFTKEKRIRVKITRDKHNIFVGKIV